MSLSDYMEEQSLEGTHDSRGSFTLDLEEAAERLSSFRLPSPYHYLLKMVQLASRLGAPEMRVKLESARTAIHFRAPRGGLVTNSEAITRAFAEPLNVKDPVLSDLVSALWGSLGDDTLEVLWSFTERYRGRSVTIKDGVFTAEDFPIEKPIEPGELPCSFTLSVLHPKRWRFWLSAQRTASALAMLVEACPLSRVRIFVDNRELGLHGAAYLTRRPSFTSPEAGHARPYTAISYDLVEDGPEEAGGFEMMRPSLSSYVVRDRTFNIWTSATRVSNTLRPDGISSPAWMLQFRKGREDLSMRASEKRVRCRLVLAYDQRAATPDGDFHLTLVRQSVVIFHRELSRGTDWWPEWRGCRLIVDNDTLPTDLTGFQVIEDTDFRAFLESLTPYLEVVKKHIAQGRPLVNGL